MENTSINIDLNSDKFKAVLLDLLIDVLASNKDLSDKLDYNFPWQLFWFRKLWKPCSDTWILKGEVSTLSRLNIKFKAKESITLPSGNAKNGKDDTLYFAYNVGNSSFVTFFSSTSVFNEPTIFSVKKSNGGLLTNENNTWGFDIFYIN